MTVLAIAHRAGNSLDGLHEANQLGADVIECDVHSYRGDLEVRHLKTAGPLPFLWDKWELVPASIARLGLAELLEAGDRSTTMMLDLKGRGDRTGREVADLLHERSHVESLWVCGRSWSSVDHVAGRLPYVRPVLSARTRPELAALLRRLRDHRAPPYGVSMHASLLTTEVVATIRSRVEVLMTWPINDEPALRRVVDLGVNAVISDEHEVLRRVLAMRS